MMMTGSSSSSSSSTAVFHRPNARFLSVPAASSHRGSTVAPIPSFSIQDSALEEDYVFPEPNPMSPSSNDCCYESALADGFLDAPPRPSQSKDDTLSFVTARVSGATAFSKSSDIADKESRRSILSSGDDEADDECSSSSSFCSGWSAAAAAAAAGDCWGKKPHQANDARWEAIRAVRARDGHLGLGHFKVLDRLGSGDIGCVYLAELSGTRTRFAVKVMDKAQLMSRKKLSRARTEREILQCLDHPFLPTLYAHFETEKFSCLVMDFCSGGDIRVLQQRQPGECFTEKASRFYAAEVLLALEYLHMLGIIYRDLKPENVLIREDGHIVLSDFDLSLMCVVFPTLVKSTKVDLVSPKNSGSYVQPPCAEPSTCMKHSCLQPTCFSPRLKGARRSKPRKENTSEIGHHGIMLPELIAEPSNARSQSFVGTHEYLAPEIIKGEGHGSAVDWWTFGIFLYELLFGKTPFKGSGHRATLFNVVCEPLEFPDLPAVSFAARDLIRGLLVKEPQQRLAYQRGAAEVKQHPFFQSINWALIRCVSPPEMPRTIINEVSTGGEFSVILEGNVGGVNLKPSGQYLDMDFY